MTADTTQADNAVAFEVFRAIHNGARIEWIQDYAEYVCDPAYDNGPKPTFASYVEFQILQEEELGENTQTPEYLPALRAYRERT